MISESGEALLCDFGLALTLENAHRDLTGAPSSAAAAGRFAEILTLLLIFTTDNATSVRYMAPELFNDAPKSAASDVFAFGMLILHVYSGRPPLARHNVGNNVRMFIFQRTEILTH